LAGTELQYQFALRAEQFAPHRQESMLGKLLDYVESLSVLKRAPIMFPMSEWFAVTRPNHPMADVRQAKKAISELPATDSVKAIEQICIWLDWIADNFDIQE
jgi:hypothetical protein